MKRAIVALARRLAVITSGLMAVSSAGPETLQPREQFAKPIEVGGNLNSTQWRNGIPRGTMDEVSSHVRLDLPIVTGKAAV